MLITNDNGLRITQNKFLRITPELYLPKPYFWLKPGENLLLDPVLGVRKWVDSVGNIFFNNQFNKNIPIGNSYYGNYPILDNPYRSTGLTKTYSNNLNTNTFTNIQVSKFINKTWRGGTSEYTIPLMNRETITEFSGKITTKGWNIYCINTAHGSTDFRWEFWTGRGFETNGFSIAKGDLCVLDTWEIVACRRDMTTTAIFQNGILKQSRTVNYFPNTSITWQFAGNEVFSNLYFNYALSNEEIFQWSHYLRILYKKLFEI